MCLNYFFLSQHFKYENHQYRQLKIEYQGEIFFRSKDFFMLNFWAFC